MTPASVHALVRSLEDKDGYTAAHTWRVVLYTRALAERFGLEPAIIERLSIGAALHDIGKIDIPDRILKKPGPLNEDEWAIMRRHTLLGLEHLRTAGIDDPLVCELVRSHHERADGLGYPDGLAGNDIPRAARFFAVIDAFDAMTSARPYFDRSGPGAGDIAAREIERGRGTRYCGLCVDAFLDLYRSGRLAWVLEYFNDRCDLPAYGQIPPAAIHASRLA
ncbi:MAG: HD domain-containing protein [Phycisphaeraceae bacterium]|nr:HD domain-containing protein [Phycisphaeraceae bacterium]